MQAGRSTLEEKTKPSVAPIASAAASTAVVDLKRLSLPAELTTLLEILLGFQETHQIVTDFCAHYLKAPDTKQKEAKVEKDHKEAPKPKGPIKEFIYYEKIFGDDGKLIENRKQVLQCTLDEARTTAGAKTTYWIDQFGYQVIVNEKNEVIYRSIREDRARAIDLNAVQADKNSVINEMRQKLFKLIKSQEKRVPKIGVADTQHLFHVYFEQSAIELHPKLAKAVFDTLIELTKFSPAIAEDLYSKTSLQDIPKDDKVILPSGYIFDFNSLVRFHEGKKITCMIQVPVDYDAKGNEIMELKEVEDVARPYPLMMPLTNTQYDLVDLVQIFSIARRKKHGIKLCLLPFTTSFQSPTKKLDNAHKLDNDKKEEAALNSDILSALVSAMKYGQIDAYNYIVDNFNYVEKVIPGTQNKQRVLRDLPYLKMPPVLFQHRAAMYGAVEVIKGCDQNSLAVITPQPEFKLPIYYAIRYDQAKVIEHLKLRGITPDQRDQFGDATVLTAAWHGDVAMVGLCIKHSANMTITSNNDYAKGGNAYHFAANREHPDFIRELYKHRVPGFLQRDANSRTPLQIAKQKNPATYAALKEVLQEALFDSAMNGQMQQVDEIFQAIQAEGVTYKESPIGENLIYCLIKNNRDEIAKQLMGQKFPQVNSRGESLMDVAINADDSTMIMKLKNVYHMEYRPDSLLRAVNNNKPNAVRALLIMEKEPLKTREGFYRAIENDFSSVVKAFTDWKYDINVPNDNAPIFQAVRSNAPAMISKLKKYGANLELDSGKGNTPAHLAAGLGHAEFIRHLHDQKADVYRLNQDQNAPIDIAIHAKKDNVVKLFIEMDPNFFKTAFARKKWHWIFHALILSSANMQFDAELQKLFVENRKELLTEFTFFLQSLSQEECRHFINATRNRVNSKLGEIFYNPAHQAAELGLAVAERNLIMMFRSLGFPINPADENGITPLYLAKKFKHANVMQVFTNEQKMDEFAPDANGDELIHIAAKTDDATMIDVLVNDPAAQGDLNKKNEKGMTPLSIAASLNRVAAARKLIEQKAQPAARNSDGTIALHVAAKQGHVAMIAAIATAETINMRSGNTGMAPLHYACQAGHRDAANELKKHGADPDIVDKLTRSPIYYAAVNKRMEMVNDFKEGLDHPNIMGLPPIHTSIVQNDMKAFDALIELKADMNVSGIHGQTAAHIAVMRLNANFITKLQSLNVDMMRVDDNKQFPIEYALTGDKNLIELETADDRIAVETEAEKQKDKFVTSFVSIVPGVFNKLVRLNRYDLVLKILLRLPGNFNFSPEDKKLLSENHHKLIDEFYKYIASIADKIDHQPSTLQKVYQLQRKIVLSALRDENPEHALNVILHIDPNRFKAWITSPIDIIRKKFDCLFAERPSIVGKIPPVRRSTVAVPVPLPKASSCPPVATPAAPAPGASTTVVRP